jgi:hypothetical protein
VTKHTQQRVCRALKKVGNHIAISVWLPRDWLLETLPLEVERSERVPKHSPSLSYNVITSSCTLQSVTAVQCGRNVACETHIPIMVVELGIMKQFCVPLPAEPLQETEFQKRVRPRIFGTQRHIGTTAPALISKGDCFSEAVHLPSAENGDVAACRSPMQASHTHSTGRYAPQMDWRRDL